MDENGRVTFDDGSMWFTGLYAAGRSANTGMHGAGMLPGNQLLEDLVTGNSAGEHAGDWATSASFGASSLVEDTLKRQLVGQYLKGRNSSRGILVLMQLDDKLWDLPGTRSRDFDELVRYLQNAANQIKLNTPSVAELHVFGIRCVK